MTHKSFRQILSWSENYTRENIEKFLDDSFECPVLEQLFELWKDGNQREMFEQIKTMNQFKFDLQKDPPMRKPDDWDLPRRKENQNFVN